MKDQIATYLQKYFPFNQLFGQIEVPDEEASFNQFKLSAGKQFFLFLLKISPYLCLGLFGTSFITPLIPNPGVQTFYQDYEPLFEALLTISVSGLIGYGTNYIAIRMLFRPVSKRPIWGQGLIPAQRERIIFTLAQGMHKHILNQDLIRSRIEESGLITRLNGLLIQGTTGILRDDELKRQLKDHIHSSILEYSRKDEVKKEIYQIIDQQLERNLDGGVKQFFLQTYKRFNQKDYEEIINKIVNDIPKIAVDVMERVDQPINRLAAYVRTQRSASESFIMKVFIDVINRIDIVHLLRKQMQHFDEARLERMIWEATNEQLLYIQYLGTLLGVLGGLLIWNTEFMLICYAIVFSLLYLADWLIYRLKTK